MFLAPRIWSRNLNKNRIASWAMLYSTAYSDLLHVEHPQKAADPKLLAQNVAEWKRPYVPIKGGFTEEEYEQYHEEGYVIKKNVFSSEDIEPTQKALSRIVDSIADDLYENGLIEDKCTDAPFLTRMTLLEKQFPNASVLMHKHGLLPQALADLWSHDQIMPIAEQVIGPNIAGHPVWNIRVKTPSQEMATVPWHQDAAYLDPISWGVQQLTAWIPLMNATKAHGCMQVIPKGHLSGKVMKHTACWRNTWYVDLAENAIAEAMNVSVDQVTESIVTCEVPMGGVLFLNNLIPHRSLDNTTDEIRWSIDLRWQDPAHPNGFDAIKGSIEMKNAKDPNLEPDWDTFSSVDRQTAATEDGHLKEHDITIFGPWMGTWPLTNSNMHTDAYINALNNVDKTNISR